MATEVARAFREALEWEAGCVRQPDIRYVTTNGFPVTLDLSNDYFPVVTPESDFYRCH